MARPLMLPVQQTDICIATQKRNITNGYNLLAYVVFFLLKEVLFSKKSIIKTYYNNLSLLDRKYDFKFSRSTGRSNISTVLLCFK